MKAWKKWLIAVFSIVLVAGITIGTVWLVNNWDALTSDTTLYTQEDIDDAYEQGLNDAGYEVILQYQEQIAIIQGQLEESQIKVGNLTDSLNQALEQNKIDAEAIAGYLDDIAELSDDITDLNNQIKLYQELLEAYENSGKYEVVFYLVQNGEQTPYDVQVVEPNGYLSEVITPEGNFEGWSLTIGGDLIESLTSVQITEDTNIYGTFYSTVTFMVNDEEYSTQQVGYNKYATEPEEPSINRYEFLGWSLNGKDTISLNTCKITNETIFYAILVRTDLSTFTPTSWTGLSNPTAWYIWSDGNNIYYSFKEQQYILNKNIGNWSPKSWNVSDLNGGFIWHYGENTYYSNDETQYVLNKETGNWDIQIWTGLSEFNATYIWKYNGKYYYSHSSEQYELESGTTNWKVKVWSGVNSFDASDIWTDGNLCYLSKYSNSYVLNQETSRWEEKTWNINRVYADGIWNDGETIYYSYYDDQYVLNKETGKFEIKTWNGLSEFQGDFIWTDGENFYYSNGTQQYVIV